MCQICQEICKQIEETFGHKVDPRKLTELIETSPLKNEDEMPLCIITRDDNNGE